MSYEPTEWTDETVNVTLKPRVEGSSVQYAVGSKPSIDREWLDYKNSPIPVENNGTMIYARLWNESKGGKETTGKVANIDRVAPKSASIEATTVGVTEIEVTAEATDGDATSTSGVSGIKKFEFYYKKTTESDYTKSGEVVVDKPTITANATYKYTGLENGTEYSLQVKVYDQVNKETQIKTAEVGATTIENAYVKYGVDLDGDGKYVSDWRLFYESEGETGEYASTNGRMYLIAADYVPTNNSILSQIITDGKAGIQKVTEEGYGDLSIYWDSIPTYRDLNLLNPNPLELFMHKGYDIENNKTNYSSRAVSTLLDTDIWKGFLDEKYGEKVIGGPTLEMWVKAWNKKLDESDGFVELRAGDVDKYGYYISSDTNENEMNLFVNGKGYEQPLTSEQYAALDKKYFLFFPHARSEEITANGATGKCYGCWFASPIAFANDCLWVGESGGLLSYGWPGDYPDDGYSWWGNGLRPVVCLKEGLRLVKDETESNKERTVYNIERDPEYVPDAEKPDGTKNIEISYDPSEWTDGTVRVGLKSNVEGYSVQYAVGSKPSNEREWLDYQDSPIPVEDNGTTIYVRLWNGTKGGKEATGTVANIDKVAPKSASIEATPIGLTEIEVTASATDGDATGTSGVSGIKKFEFYYRTGNSGTYTKAGEVVVDKPTTTANTTYNYTGLESGTEYSLQVKVYDQVNKEKTAESSATTKKYMGEYVKYEVDLDGDDRYISDWRLFYESEGETGDYASTNGRMYLIAADYVPTDNSILSQIITDGTAGIQKATSSNNNAALSVYWPSAPTYRDLNSLKPNPLEMFMHKGYDIASHKSNNNSKAVSTLLDTNIWKGFLDGKYGEKVIGGPTEEMWVKAWNKTLDEIGDPDEGFAKLRAGDTNSYGYYISSDTNENANFLYMNGTTYMSTTWRKTLEKKYFLFFPHTSNSNITANGVTGDSDGYWLASPSSYYNNVVRFVNYAGYVNSVGHFERTGYGLRPVVCLTSGVHLEKSEEDSNEERTVYNIVEN